MISFNAGQHRLFVLQSRTEYSKVDSEVASACVVCFDLNDFVLWIRSWLAVGVSTVPTCEQHVAW